jgi:segregation and condensation protein B
MPGHPLVYTTSKNFMDYFGINSTDDLPKIREVLAEQLVEGTLINPEDFNYNMNVPETMDQVEMNENYSTETEPIAEEETSTDDNTASSEPTDEQPI